MDPHGSRDLQISHAAGTFGEISSTAADWLASQELVWAFGETLTESHHAPTTVLQKRRNPPRKLDSVKCTQCRQDKVKCSPQPRLWPQKCERCASKRFECSPGEIKRRPRKRTSPIPPTPLDVETASRENQFFGVRDETAEKSDELHFEDSETNWDYTDLTNLVVFVQLLNHERSFLAETGSFLKNLTSSGAGHKSSSYFVQSTDELNEWLEPLITHIKLILYDRQDSDNLSTADHILCENAHEALDKEPSIPTQRAISKTSLTKLPDGMRICHLIRTLKLEIQTCGACDFKPLGDLVLQFSEQWTTWQTRFGIKIGPDYVFQRNFHPYPRLYSASISLVLAQDLKQHVIRHWIRNGIETSSGDQIFPVRKVAEIWNAANDLVDISYLNHVIDVEETDSERHSLLHAAVLCDKPRIVRALVENNPTPDCTLTRAGYNAFHYAASVGSVDCYRELLKCRNAVTLRRMPGDGLGQFTLHIAARNGHKEMVDYILLAHSDDELLINAQNRRLETPLMLAAEAGNLDVVRSLLAHPRLNLTLGDKDGRTALIRAGGNGDIVRLIISKLPAAYFNKRRKGVTPLHLLAKFAGYDLMQLVLSVPSIRPDEGAEGYHGDTPLCEAVRAGNVEAVKALGIRRDVDVKKLSLAFHGGDLLIQATRKRVRKADDNWSQILDWLKRNCKELEADLRDWKASTSGSS